MAKQERKSAPLPLVALVLACLVPGAGHAYIGRVRRGIVIFVTVMALFWSGVGIGGVLTVDSQRERWWFFAEIFTGVHGLIGWHRQRKVYENLPNVEGESLDQKLQNSGVALVAPAEGVARAYAGVAGLLNLMCIFDALMLSLMGVAGEPASEPDRRRKAGKASEI